MATVALWALAVGAVTGWNRPKLESAWRIEGDLQLMIASFAGEKS
jgi:hypothetical protein